MAFHDFPWPCRYLRREDDFRFGIGSSAELHPEVFIRHSDDLDTDRVSAARMTEQFPEEVILNMFVTDREC